MAQVSTSPDYLQTNTDRSLNEDQLQSPNSGEKMSFMGKMKAKTKDRTNKLKTKLKKRSSKGENDGPDDEVTEGAPRDDTSSSSSSDDESESPVNNAIEGVTQPQYQENLDEGYHPPGSRSDEFSPGVPSTDFPGNHEGMKFADSLPTEDDSSISKEFEGLSTNDKGESGRSMTMDSEELTRENLQEGMLPEGSVVEKVDPSEQSVKSEDAPWMSAKEETANVDSKSSDAGKSWSQWAAEKVGYGKDTAATETPSTVTSPPTDTSVSEGPKPITTRALEAAVGAKDAVHAQLIKPAYEKVVGTKGDTAEKTETISSSPPVEQQSYVQKATSGLYAAKDSIYSSTQPGEEHKVLSQMVTETVENLPATIKSSLGFGAKSPGSSSPTTTPVPSDSITTASNEADGAPAQSPGLVSRFTSLFSGSGKKPAGTEESEHVSASQVSQVAEGGDQTEVSETKTE